MNKLSRSVATLFLVLMCGLPCLAQSASASDGSLDIASLAARAQARQASLEAQLATINSQTPPSGTDPSAFAATQAQEREQLTDLLQRNATVLQAYNTRLGAGGGTTTASAGSPAAPSNSSAAPTATTAGPAAPSNSAGPAAPSSSGGLLSSLGSMLGGGSSSTSPQDAGPTSVATGEGSATGAAPSLGSSLLDYLKNNWPGLVGATVGSIAGSMIASRFMGGSMLGKIVGSMVGGWIGQKLGDWAGSKFLGIPGASSSTTALSPSTTSTSSSSSGGILSSIESMFGMGGSSGSTAAPASDPVQTYSAPPAQTAPAQTAPATTAASATAAPASLAAARTLMQQRYQSFLAAGGNSDPALQATAYQSYMTAKNQYEALQYQGATTAGQ